MAPVATASIRQNLTLGYSDARQSREEFISSQPGRMRRQEEETGGGDRRRRQEEEKEEEETGGGDRRKRESV